MKCVFSCMSSFFLCLSVLFYSVLVISGYVFDNVHSYGGPTPMALDTALSLLILSAAGCIISTLGLKGRIH